VCLPRRLAVAYLFLVRRCYAPRVNESHFAIVSSIIYRQIHPSETAAVSFLAREVFDKFVAPHYQTEGVAEFHRYASAEAFSQRHESGHITLVAEHSGELVGMLHLREPCHVSMLFVQSSVSAAASVVGCSLLRVFRLAIRIASSPSTLLRMPYLLSV